MFRWTLTFVALIALSRVATADDDFITEQPSDTGTAAEAETEAAPWADKVLIDTQSRSVLLVWFEGEQTQEVPFTEVSQLLHLPAYQGSAAEVLLETADGTRHLLVMGTTARQDAQVLAAIMAAPLKTVATSDEHLVPPEQAGDPGPRLTLGSISSPFAGQDIGEALEESSGFGNVTDTVSYTAPAGFIRGSDGTGELERSGIALGIRTRMSTYKGCYQRQLQRTPNLRGTITVEFVIEKDGLVERVRVASSSLNNEQVEQCIVQNLEGSQFPTPRGGTVVVTYPFNFTRG
jgi:TonB family protein